MVDSNVGHSRRDVLKAAPLLGVAGLLGGISALTRTERKPLKPIKAGDIYHAEMHNEIVSRLNELNERL